MLRLIFLRKIIPGNCRTIFILDVGSKANQELDKKVTLSRIQRLLEENPIIYQYSSIEGAKPLLNEMTLMIKNPITFNDPHDCDLRLVNFNSVKKENLKESIKKFNSSQQNSNIDYEYLSTEKIKHTYEKLIFPNLFDTFGVACFSKNCDNSLMWSHYTYSHKGICIGFDIMKLYLNLSALRPKELALIEVNYTEKFESIDYFEQKDDAIHHWIRTKSSIWEYEEEIRILFTNLTFNYHKKILFEFDKRAISQIILGYKIDPKDEIWIKKFCKNNLPDIEIYKMEKVENSFELKLEKIKF